MLTARGILRLRARLLVVALVLALFQLAAPAAPAHADFTALCNGYAGCRDAGYGSSGYAQNNDAMYWRMYSGHNCTNYAAYRMVHAGMPNSRPWSGVGNAENWGHAMAFLTDGTPTVGAVAWWDQYVGYAGSAGHVAYVEKVVSSTEIIVSEDMWGGDFHWRRVTKSGRGWPSGFIHFHDVALVNKTAPTITGTPQVGQTLTAAPGTWSAAPTSVTYQWFADGQAITGATGSTLLLGPAREGQVITVQAAAAATGFASAIATSTGTAAVTPGVITPVETPAITGPAELGGVLTASKGTWAPGSTTKTVQWQSDGQPIEGAIGWTLELGPGQVATHVTAVVTATRKGYVAATVATAPTESVLGGDVTITAPFTLDPSAAAPVLGRELQVVPGTVDPADAIAAYTWLRDGVEIPDANERTYVPGPDDVGHRLSVRADVTREGYKPATQTTDPSAPVHSVPDIEVTALGGRQRARVAITVTAPGVPVVNGPITVKVGVHQVTINLREGARTVVVRDLHAGRRRVVVRYPGQDLVDAGVFRGTVEVLKPRR